ncbi:mediator of RNA polymerase II transcription subunit 4-like [Nasonia vitripennis]|uniref:Mediator of RNA polymerase II transcription subunit 4 n=1 Tax=Nasonia vitripennis TaxID=7425 RepID=A0A7M7G5I2_NASVI|nr:mediator of RNA polymerase II transcription subunit 4-like [Nasonia vitripennis]XP_008204769.1 mediator of RNA polymerase II transcription subunit 4-like [Nasonia vitripennis]
MPKRSTRDVLLSIVDDIEMISKELIENIIAEKHSKLSTADHTNLIELLMYKDKELKSVLVKADEQAKINQKMEALKAEVDYQDQVIQQLQRQLKETEQILATAIYQSKQKLRSIATANKRPVSSEELIKFALSTTNAMCAPLTWQQGDPRRPYPIEIEMRMGWLQQLELYNTSLTRQMFGLQSSFSSDLHMPTEPPVAQASSHFAWHPSGDLHMSVGAGQRSVPITAHKRKSEDIEMMSTDSSSTSSSDSQ